METEKKVSTGISFLDFILKGGIPDGSMVTIVSDPRFPIDSFLFRLLSVRKSYYVATRRKPEYIRMEMGDILQNQVEFIDLHSKYHLERCSEKEVLEFIEKELERMRGEDNFNLIFEGFSFLLDSKFPERNILEIVNKVYGLCKETNSIASLDIVRSPDISHRIVRILEISDTVIEIEFKATGGGYSYILTIPKNRRGILVTDPLKLYLTESGELEVDTTRDVI